MDEADAHELRWASEFSRRENCHLKDGARFYKYYRS